MFVFLPKIYDKENKAKNPMTYSQTIEYLYNTAPMFQKIGSAAYKEGMENSFLIDEHLGQPHKKYQTVHVGGTNGKGSVCHILASILQEAGYKTGLYTSPHLLDFRERIRVNGQMIEQQYVVDFVEKHKTFFESIEPSFFELTTGMAFDYFASQNVDIAIVEVGLGGRLDCTNVITPVLSIITNISFDHTNLLGNTLTAIAGEKAGIIKSGVPVIIGEATDEIRNVFVGTLRAMPDNGNKNKIFFAEDETFEIQVDSELKGYAQQKNTATVLCALEELKKMLKIPQQAIKDGFSKVVENTGLMGRWQIVGHNPEIIFDTGHNVGGMSYNVSQLQAKNADALHIVFGMVNDKDISGVLALLPKNAKYYFTQASIPRALNSQILAEKADAFGLKGEAYSNVAAALTAAKRCAGKKDVIFVGGSTFVVADALISRN